LPVEPPVLKGRASMQEVMPTRVTTEPFEERDFYL
jgi:hypothetical protein